MDTSKEYIKMCEMAVEIQESWSPTDDDLYVYAGYRDLTAYLFCKRKLNKPELHSVVWLPRQDQSQNMFGSPDDCFYMLYWLSEGKFLCVGGRFRYYGYDSAQFKSMEQIFLAAVMYKNHNKIWVDSEWEVCRDD